MSRMLRAAELSLKKWKKNVKAKNPGDVKLGAENCALCNLYLNNDCYGCPIAFMAGNGNCSDTPYMNASNAFDSWEVENNKNTKATWLKAAAKEVVFIEKVVEFVKKMEL